MGINISRRGFLFGATAAAVVVSAPKSFFIIEPPKIILTPSIRPMIMPGRLPLQQLLDLQKKLDDAVLEVSAIPRWLYTSEAEYNAMVGKADISWQEARARAAAARRQERDARLLGRG